MIPKEHWREVCAQIRHVFNDVWDPIGVMDDPTWPSDEYDAYIGRMFGLLTRGATDQEIGAYLSECVERIGLDASRSSYQDVIAALRKIDLQPGS